MPPERRRSRRFEVSCAVTVAIVGRRQGSWSAEGRLCDMGDSGARFHLASPLTVGTRLGIDMHFMNRDNRITTMHFTGTVLRAQQQPPFETAVRFETGARFVRDRAKVISGGASSFGGTKLTPKA